MNKQTSLLLFTGQCHLDNFVVTDFSGAADGFCITNFTEPEPQDIFVWQSDKFAFVSKNAMIYVMELFQAAR